MSWFQKIIPPKIQRRVMAAKKVVPEGLWSKCDSCEEVLYRAELEQNLNVCPKCGHHNRVGARKRLEFFLDEGGMQEIGANVIPVDSLKFKDSKRYVDRLSDATDSILAVDPTPAAAGNLRYLLRPIS